MEPLIFLPKMGLTMEEATLIHRTADPGKMLCKDDTIAEVETDKALLEIKMPCDGVIAEWLANEGDVVQVGMPLARMTATESERLSPPASRKNDLLIPISPSARRKAKELGVNYRLISGTGPGGRILHADIIESLMHPASMNASPPSAAGSDETAVVGTDSAPFKTFPAETRIPLAPMRRRIAQKMVESVTTIPQFHLKRRVDVTQINELKAVLQPSFEKSRQVKLSFNDFVILAAAAALKAHPQINASFRGTPLSQDSYIAQYNDINIGIAVAVRDGVLLPVIHKASKLSLAEIAVLRTQRVQEAKAGNCKTEHLQGGTFTISSLGTMGVEEFTAIIHPPEAGILAVGGIVEEPVVRDHSIQIRPMVTITGSFDHRVVDGALAAAFMNTLVKQLESDAWVLF